MWLLRTTLSVLLAMLIHVAGVQGATVYQPAWASVNMHNPGGNAPEWFKDAKFGIYFHWGIYSVPAYGSEWYPKYMYITGKPDNLYHIATYGDPKVWPYHFFINGGYDLQGNYKKFAPRLVSQGGNFDPDAWAQLFADAGAKFAGPVAEHHDGFSMWASTVNPWNAVNKGPGMDLVGKLTTAIRSKNLKIICSMHHCYNFTGFFQAVAAQTDTNLQMLYGQLPRSREEQLWLAKLKEVIDGYQPDILWQDFNMTVLTDSIRLQFLSYYYNKAIDWNREVVATYKNTDFNQNCALLDYERGGPGDLTPYYWLTDDAISPTSWCYTTGLTYYATAQILHSFIDRVSKNGNLLLNISPMADGTIPQAQKDILLGMGNWLKKFGECIYSTRAWTVFGEGPTVMGGGAFVAPVTGTAKDIRFTRSKDSTALYAIVLGWPGNGANLTITSLGSRRITLNRLIGVTLLDTLSNHYLPLSYIQDTTGLHITMPAVQPYTAMAYPVKLVFSGAMPPLAVSVSRHTTMSTYRTAGRLFFNCSGSIPDIRVPNNAVGLEAFSLSGNRLFVYRFNGTWNPRAFAAFSRRTASEMFYIKFLTR